MSSSAEASESESDAEPEFEAADGMARDVLGGGRDANRDEGDADGSEGFDVGRKWDTPALVEEVESNVED